MKLELPLLSYIEVGERAAVRVPAPETAGGRGVGDRPVITYRSSDPEVLAIGPDSVLEGRSPGHATVTAEARVGGDETTATLDIQVIAPAAPRGSLRPGHPRIRYTTEELSRRRASVTQGRLPGLGIDLGQQFRALVAHADELVAERAFTLTYDVSGEVFVPTHSLPIRQPPPLPQPRGFTDYPFWTALSRAVEQRMTTLALAYSLTGERRYAQQAKEYLLALAGWDKWHEYDKATNNLSLPHFTIGAAVTYDEIEHLLSDEERAQVRAAILDLGLRPMSYWFGRRLDHNITVLMNVGMVVGYLAIGDELPYLDKYFVTPLADLRWYLAQREEGTTTEGLLYTSYAMNYLLTVAAQIRRATGNDELLQSPFIASTLPELFLYFRGSQGGLANLSDARHEDGSASIMAHLVSEHAHPIAAWLIHRYHRDNRNMLLYLTRDVAVASPTDLGLPPSKVFAPMGWAALRSGWGDDDTLLAFTASASAVGHNHFDQNHFILNVGGEWLLTDPGYQNYSPGAENFFTNATLGHNALLVNGQGQEVKGQARIVDAFLAPGFAAVAGDATGGYAGRLQRWVRTVVFVKPWYLLLVDEIVPNESGDALELLFHTCAAMTRAGRPLAVGEEFADQGAGIEIVGQQARVALFVAQPERPRFRHEQFVGAERFGAYLRVQPAAAGAHRIVTVLQPLRGQDRAAPIAVQPQGAGDVLHLVVERERERDFHCFDRTGAAATAATPTGAIACQAEHALVTLDRSTGVVTRAVVRNGTQVAAPGQLLIDCDRPVHAAVAYSSRGISGSVAASVACRFGMHVPDAAHAPRVLLDGAVLSEARVAYNAAHRMVVLPLDPGDHTVRLHLQPGKS